MAELDGDDICEGVRVCVRLGDCVPLRVPVLVVLAVPEPELLEVCVELGVKVPVGEPVGLRVPDGLGERAWEPDCVAVVEGVAVEAALAVTVALGVSVALGVGAPLVVDVRLAVWVCDAVGIAVCVTLCVSEALEAPERVSVAVGDWLGEPLSVALAA